MDCQHYFKKHNAGNNLTNAKLNAKFNSLTQLELLEIKGSNERTKESGAMHFNIRKTCVPWYDDEEVGAVEDENGNVNVRKAVGVHVMDEYDTIDPNETTNN